MTSDEFGLQFSRLGAGFRKALGQATFEVYYEALSGLHPQDLQRAVTWAIHELGAFPVPAALIERARHEKAARLEAERRALPPAPEAEALPDWVTEGSDIGAMVAELKAKLTVAEARVLNGKAGRPDRKDPITKASDPYNEAHLPYPRGTAEDLDWRAERAALEIERLRQYCQEQGIPWRT